MKFKFWGVRGSIAAPGPHTARYGGNTTCIEVRTSTNELLILDAGTGIYPLSLTLVDQMPITAHILLTHTHWDHIQGLPFFRPLLKAHNQVHIYGARDPNTGEGIERALNVQLQYSFFPVGIDQLQAKVDFHTMPDNVPFYIGQTRITPVLLNHPGDDFGYRIDDADGSSLFFTGDYEPPADLSEAQTAMAAMQGVNALILDASYTEEEYQTRKNWGHGTFDSALELADASQCQQLILTHHESMRSDDELDAIFSEFQQRIGDKPYRITLAREGDEQTL